MEAKKGRIAVIIALGVLLSGVIWFVYQNRGKHFRWYETYRYDDKEPYGGFFITEMLNDYAKDGKFKIKKDPLRDWMKEDLEKGNYIFVGDELFLDTAACDLLLSYIEKGNTAFIASKFAPAYLTNTLRCTENCYAWNSDHNYKYQNQSGHYFYHKAIHTNFNNDSLKNNKDYVFEFAMMDSTYNYDWRYFNKNSLCNQPLLFNKLGTIDSGFVNFINVPHGKGNFYFHSNPILFTNYFMDKPEGREYAEKTLSYLSEGNIYWDEFSRIYWNNSHEGGLGGDSPLRFILSQPALRWAWYTLLALTLLFIIFYAKRRQRIIPVTIPNENTSLEFVKIIARLGFLEKQHQGVCRQKMQVFMLFLRNKYKVKSTLPQVSDEFIKTVSMKSAIAQENVEAIFKKYNWIHNTVLPVDDKELIAFYNQLEDFYKTCK